MKRLILFFPILLLFAAACVAAVSGEGEFAAFAGPDAVSDEMIEVLINNLENIFPLSSQRQLFSTYAEALYSDVGEETMVRKETADGKRNITMVANPDGVREYIACDTIDDAYPSDFQLTMDVTIDDAWPSGQAGCLIGYTNYGVSAFSEAEGAVTVGLLIDGASAVLYMTTPERDAGMHIDLGDVARRSSKLSILHLTEHTYVFVNGRFMGQFHDGKAGGFQLIYGSALFAEGDSVSCSFDNLAIRKVSTK